MDTLIPTEEKLGVVALKLQLPENLSFSGSD